eukprot:PhM_4_TR17767/c0_g1_i1/m.843
MLRHKIRHRAVGLTLATVLRPRPLRLLRQRRRAHLLRHRAEALAARHTDGAVDRAVHARHGTRATRRDVRGQTALLLKGNLGRCRAATLRTALRGLAADVVALALQRDGHLLALGGAGRAALVEHALHLADGDLALDDVDGELRAGVELERLLAGLLLHGLAAHTALLLHLEVDEALHNVLIDEVGDVHAVDDLGDHVVLPVLVVEQVVLRQRREVHAGAAKLVLPVLLRHQTRRHEARVGDLGGDGVGDVRGALVLVARHRHGAVDTVADVVGETAGVLLAEALSQQQLAGHRLELADGVVLEGACLDPAGVRAGVLEHLLHELRLLRVEVLQTAQIALVKHNHDGLSGEERLDVAEERDLRLDGVAARTAQVHEVHDRRLEVGQRRDGLHLDDVALVEAVVEDTGRVDDLPRQVLVVGVANVERLRREGVRLHLNVRARDLVDEARLTHGREATHEHRAGVGVDAGETG